VFLLNSRFSLFSDNFYKKLLLIPKLQSHFAEFLPYNYPERVCMFYKFTWVGLKYGILLNFYSISWKKKTKKKNSFNF